MSKDSQTTIYIPVPFGMLVWSTGLAPNPLIQSISELAKDDTTGRSSLFR